jgi:serine/threonine protein kinase
VPAGVPGYELLEEVGRGGMGVIFKARQLQPRRLVALKMILAGAYAGPDTVARFKAEAEAVARLTHPNIVQIYHVGEHEGRPFLALEFVEGGNLANLLDTQKLSFWEKAELVQQLALAVDYAHRRGILHRDLKPANVLLAPAPERRKTLRWVPKITDFGLAKPLEAAASMQPGVKTRTGAVVGTPAYMAPEQAGGKSTDVYEAADVYALGAILYECLTDRPPFRGQTMLDILMKVLTEEPVRPRKIRRRCPRDLETICLKCLQKDPNKRYETASDLAEDIKRYQEDEPIRARPPGKLAALRRALRRHNQILCFLAGALVASLVFAGVLWIKDRRGTSRKPGGAVSTANQVAESTRDAPSDAPNNTPPVPAPELPEVKKPGPAAEPKAPAVPPKQPDPPKDGKQKAPPPVPDPPPDPPPKVENPRVVESPTQAKPLFELPVELQLKVNGAVELGASYLRKAQQPDGSWVPPSARYPIGLNALPALTLLECGDARADAHIQAAANIVRAGVAEVDSTYEISLSILLLDRIGDLKDKKYIQTLALRLICGQSVTGGWDYKCPLLDLVIQQKLLRVLQELNRPAAKKETPKPKPVIPRELQVLPIFQDRDFQQLIDPESPGGARVDGTTDNANTQFAVLALAAARRWDVPVQQTMELVARRFLNSQEESGGWGYFYRKGGGAGETMTMTCAGLIGLAVAQQLTGKDDKPQALQDVPQIRKGLEALDRHIGSGTNNRFFLWSLERVGVLCDLPRVGNKDWYNWGAQLLVRSQQQQGTWPKSEYQSSEPLVDTCFALLFLKKANPP